MIQISLCLSDLPKDKIKQAKNGKKYVNLILAERKEKSKYGETHTLMVSRTKEEREANPKTGFVGSGILYEDNSTSVTPEDIDNYPVANDEDGLPF